MTDLEQELDAFGRRLDWYLDYTKIPKAWFRYPDHAVVVAEDISDFQQLVDTPQKEKVFRNLEADERFDVSAKIAGALSVGRVGRVEWVEIFEPRDIDQIAGMIGLLAVKFHYSHFGQVRYIMGVRNIPYELSDHGDHAEIHVRFDNENNRFSLSNRPIEELTLEKIIKGEVQELKPAA